MSRGKEAGGTKLKVVAIAQARMGSTRAPGKVMRDLGGKPVLAWTIDALLAAPGIDEVVLATSVLPADDIIAQYCIDEDITYFRGDESDVLDRFYKCAIEHSADIILRLTCDCPFLDPAVIAEVVKLQAITGASYVSNIDPPSYPDGLDVECFTFEALEAAWSEAVRATDRDCVPQYISRNRDRFPAANLTCPLPGLAKERWVLDTEADYEFCKKVVESIGTNMYQPSYVEILDLLEKNPHIKKINADGIRNERFYEGLATEDLPTRTFERSTRILKRATKTIPFGAQTFSKSHIQFPAGSAPLYCSHADGARIFDVDGNDYVDLVSAVLPVILGYRDPDVDEAIRRQLDNGISFSLATKMESELSELLCKHIPCAEMVKFGKSGTDVTTAAVRLARAYTGRDHVLVGGYHGWSDWSMACTDRNLGIPTDVADLSHRFNINIGDIPVGPKKIAAIIVEPNELRGLPELREFCTNNGIVLVFDEVITGFRYSMGGAQKLFGVTPDLACFGKAMANGMPISAIVGKRDIMKLMEPPGNIFYSGTMFGETLSIAAAIACIKKLEREHVLEHIWDIGAKLKAVIETLIVTHGLTDVMSISGLPPRSVLTFRDGQGATANQIRTLFMSRMAQNGVLIINSNNLSFAHKGPELSRIITAYTFTLDAIADPLARGNIAEIVGDSVVEAAPLRVTA